MQMIYVHCKNHRKTQGIKIGGLGQCRLASEAAGRHCYGLLIMRQGAINQSINQSINQPMNNF